MFDDKGSGISSCMACTASARLRRNTPPVMATRPTISSTDDTFPVRIPSLKARAPIVMLTTGSTTVSTGRDASSGPA